MSIQLRSRWLDYGVISLLDMDPYTEVDFCITQKEYLDNFLLIFYSFTNIQNYLPGFHVI